MGEPDLTRFIVMVGDLGNNGRDTGEIIFTEESRDAFPSSEFGRPRRLQRKCQIQRSCLNVWIYFHSAVLFFFSNHSTKIQEEKTKQKVLM